MRPIANSISAKLVFLLITSMTAVFGLLGYLTVRLHRQHLEQSTLLSAWWITTLPGLVVVLFGIGAGLLGDGLSDGRLRGGL